MTAIFRILRFSWRRAAGSRRSRKWWISRFGMAVSGWDRPEKAAKKLQKNCIFSGKKFCGALFVPVRAAADLSEGAKWFAALSRIRAGAVMA
ncbi:hypothetical protein ACQZ48_18470 [Agrobacterium sp. 22-209-1]|uniref:hypothetical protein n=1 Tax=Agrobacterium salinitolerans TaxID=1183413 RepID=UPI0015738304|nr:hypothetical protein [Agrobacterium salinitolerans]NTA37316.1 hypothetical protein [Agrobacterium salinitolerans]